MNSLCGNFKQDFPYKLLLKYSNGQLNKNKRGLISISEKHYIQCIFYKIPSPLNRLSTYKDTLWKISVLYGNIRGYVSLPKIIMYSDRIIFKWSRRIKIYCKF